jgi:protein transport protein SEC31
MPTISRTSTFAWSPSQPYLATGTVSGALDASFSNEAELEIWAPFESQGQNALKGSVGVGARQVILSLDIWLSEPQRARSCLATTRTRTILLALVSAFYSVKARLLTCLYCSSRFNRLAWGYVDPQTRPLGVIAAGMENGELVLWDPEKIIAGAE